MVGLPDAAVRESAQRVTSALKNSALAWADGVKTVNLAPADLKKEGPRFDLPMALALAQTAGEEKIRQPELYCVAGELALDGMVRPIRGVLSMVIEAKRRGRCKVVVPIANAREAAIVEGVEVYGVKSLRDAWELMTGQRVVAPEEVDRKALFASGRRKGYGDLDLRDVKGQNLVKRALEIAAAGSHNLLILFCIYPTNNCAIADNRIDEKLRLHKSLIRRAA